MQFSFRKPHFWHSQNFAKTLFWHTVALFVFLKMPKKHYKTGEKTAKKNLDQFLTLDLDQFVTLETPNLGPVFNSTAYIYIYIYIYIFFCCKVKNWSKIWGFKVKHWSKFKVKNWSKFFHCFPHFCSVFWVFLKTQIVSHCAKIVFFFGKILGMLKMRFSTRKLHFLFLSFFMLEK